MDKKTLEYMEERAKKGRRIVNEIARLTAESYDLVNKSAYKVAVSDGNRSMFTTENNERLRKAIISSIIEVSAQEIAKLEAELAEL